MLLDPVAAPSGWRARLALGFERRGARTVLAHREHDGPLVVQKALHPEGEAVCHAIVVHPPAGLVGGDDLRLEAAVGEGAHALLTTPGAGKWYRSARAWASQQVRLEVAAHGIAEWLPQETIVFEGARARISWSADLAASARLIAWDIYCLGRTGSGEGFAHGHVALDTRVTREGRLVWLERGRIDGGSTAAASAAHLGGQPVFGTLLVAAPVIDEGWIALARAESPREGECGVTRLPGALLVRYRGASAEAAGEYFRAIRRRLRQPVLGCAPVEPRIWST